MGLIKLIDQLNSLDLTSLGRFNDFIHSPFHNTNKRIQLLFLYIKKIFLK